MSVNLIIKKTLTGGAIADSLVGGSQGLDLGQCLNSEYTPIILQGDNTGYQDIYVEHNSVIDPIQDYVTYVSEFSGIYGGAQNAAADIATLIAKGQADNGLTANNSDGLSSGLRIEHGGINIGSLGSAAFLPSRAQVSIYGDNGTDGIDLDSGFVLHEDAMVWNNGGIEVDATTPIAGQIGVAGDTVLGDNAHIGLRFYLEDAATQGGYLQFDWIHAYSFTA